MNAIIIDDEESGREALALLVKRFCKDVTVVATADSPEGGIAAIREHSPDIVFLDVEMPGGTGFTVLEAFPRLAFHVIFVTAYQHYALKAIKFAALDYLLKPVDVQDLINAVAKAVELKATDAKPTTVSAQQQATAKHTDSIAVPVEDGLVFINPADILRCESDSNYTTCFLNSGQKMLVSRTLKEFEELLAPLDFARIHNSHLINLRGVVRYVRGKGGYVVMRDGSEVEVSPRKRDTFLEHFSRV